MGLAAIRCDAWRSGRAQQLASAVVEVLGGAAMGTARLMDDQQLAAHNGAEAPAAFAAAVRDADRFGWCRAQGHGQFPGRSRPRLISIGRFFFNVR